MQLRLHSDLSLNAVWEIIIDVRTLRNTYAHRFGNAHFMLKGVAGIGTTVRRRIK